MLVTTFLLAIRSIRRHILRSFLTILGIVIGVGNASQPTRDDCSRSNTSLLDSRCRPMALFQ